MTLPGACETCGSVDRVSHYGMDGTLLCWPHMLAANRREDGNDRPLLPPPPPPPPPPGVGLPETNEPEWVAFVWFAVAALCLVALILVERWAS